MRIISNFLNDFFSINESKKSVVIIVFLLFSGIGAYNTTLSGDLSNNITTIILTLGGIIFGVNSIGNIVSSMNQKKEKNFSDYNNDDFTV